MQSERNKIIELYLVMLGGGIGGSLRFTLGLMPVVGHWPITTVGINLTGAFLLAFLGTFLPYTSQRTILLKSFLGTGVIGGFTTFSTMMLEFYEIQLCRPMNAFPYLMVTIIGGILVVKCGHNLGRYLYRNRYAK
ncbi:fluoride efflux transporter FluC [Leuconostoc palmae]|uniref:fluoride efflux transporter FluC n=1 Tax=Leuconostoc palmae TaxID=501487 RepID=UPI001C7DA67A|nr:CrcB family protein [Leuconostoc palmae]